MSCNAITRGGGRCKGTAIDSSGLCHAHHPARAEARQRAARKGGQRGGRGRSGPVEIAELKGQLSDLYANVLKGTVEPKVAAVAAQVANVRARIVQTEPKVREQLELEARLEELEALLETSTPEGNNRWG